MSTGYSRDPYSDTYEYSKQRTIGRRHTRVYAYDSTDYDSRYYNIPPPPPVPRPRPLRPRSPSTVHTGPGVGVGTGLHRTEPDYGDSRPYPRREDRYYADYYERLQRFMHKPPHGRTRYRSPAGGYYPEEDYYPLTSPRTSTGYGCEPRREMRDHFRDHDYYHDHEYDHNHEPAKRTPSTERSGTWKSIVAIFVVIMIFMLLFYYFGNNPSQREYREYPEGIDFTIRKSMTLELEKIKRGDYISYKLKSACPKDKYTNNPDSGDNILIQDIKELTVQPEPTNGFPNIDSPDQWIMLWEEDWVLDQTRATRTFIIEYVITTYFYEWKIGEDDSKDIRYIPTSLKDQYNHDEWRYDQDGDGFMDAIDDLDGDEQWDYMIEPNDPEIQNLANQLAGNEKNVYKVVKKIYDYLTKPENLNYVTNYDGLPKPCIQTLAERKGDCDDYSILFISLCRAVDIPAWLELGVLYDRESREWGGHAWAGVVIPLENDVVIKPTIDIVNKQFLLFDPYRFIEWKDTGGNELYPGETEERNNLDYYYHTFSYQGSVGIKVTPPDTNNFMTLEMDTFGDTKRIAVDEDSGYGGLCMLPGFDSAYMVISVISTTAFILIAKKRRFERNKKTHNNNST